MKKFTLSLMLSVFTLFTLQATVYTSINDGDWFNPTTWSPNGVPDISIFPGDEITITHTITTSQNLTFNNQSKLSIQSGGSLLSTKEIEISAGFSGDFIIMNGATISCKDFTKAAVLGTISISGNFNCTRDMTFSGAAVVDFNNATIQTKNFLVTIGANVEVSNSTLTVSNDIEFSGSSLSTFNNTTLAVGDNFDMESSAKAFFTGGSIQVTDNLSIAGSTMVDLMGTDVAVGKVTSLAGSSKITINGDAFVDFNDLTLENSSSIIGENTAGILAFNSLSILHSASIKCAANNCNFGAGSSPPSPLDLETGMQFLPVELLFFKAIQQENSVNLVWATASEKNNAFFEIQKSYDAKKWSTYEIIEGAINSNQRLNYAVEAALEVKHSYIYYRLKQVDLDGEFTYSNIEVIDNELVATNVSIYPNPTNGHFKVAAALPIQSIRIYSPQGQLIQVMKNEEEGQVGITLPDNLTKGYYYLQVLTENGVESHQLLLE